MPKRKRCKQVCLRLTDEEFSLWQKKCSDSGMSKTDFLMSAIRNSTVKIYRIDEAIKPMLKELRYIGSNINQLAYFSNIGQEYVGNRPSAVRQEIEAVRRKHNLIMEEISEFLRKPKFDTECLDT